MDRRSSKRAERAARRRQAGALQLVLGGVALIVVPHLMGNAVFAAALRPLATIGWGMLLVGGVALWLLRQKSDAPAKPAMPIADLAPPRARQPAWRPPRGAARVERIDPVNTAPVSRAAGPDAVTAAAPMRPASWSPSVFAAIEWRRFEAVVETLFGQAGFITKAQSHGPDEGVDVWLHSKNQPDGAPVSLVQCKHWPGRQVGVDKVRELRGVMAAKGVTRGQFAATGGFTSDAIAFATKNGIKLHDIAGLVDLIGSRTPEQQQALLAVALEGDYWRPTCVNCGIKMVERQPGTGGRKFWGCTNFPRCRTTMALRAG